MSAELLAVAINALTHSRPVVEASLGSILQGAYLLNRDLEPIRSTLPEDDRLFVEAHEDVLRRIDLALDGARAAGR